MDVHLKQQIRIQIEYNQRLESISIDSFSLISHCFLLVVVRVDDQEQVKHDRDE
jgi:hypothetical protein